ncbi:MAG TPA: hypothetical protein VD864_00865 [Nocardioides sp.]|nr:hypothetical protein [Nocardioides sp.]
MTKYTITAPEPTYKGEFAGLVFQAGKARAETPADLAAVTYCRRRGYTVVAVDSEGEPLPDDEQPGEGTPDPDASTDDAPSGEDSGEDAAQVKRPADSASKPDWVAYAVTRGATEDDANSATKNELIELYG